MLLLRPTAKKKSKNERVVVPGSGGGYNNSMINIGGHFTRCHISVNIEFTNLCSWSQFQHILKYEYHILLEIQMMNFTRMLNLETMLNLTR